MLFLAKGHCRIPQAGKFIDENVVDRTKLEIYLEYKTVMFNYCEFFKQPGLKIFKSKYCTRVCVETINDLLLPKIFLK